MMWYVGLNGRSFIGRVALQSKLKRGSIGGLNSGDGLLFSAAFTSFSFALRVRSSLFHRMYLAAWSAVTMMWIISAITESVTKTAIFKEEEMVDLSGILSLRSKTEMQSPTTVSPHEPIPGGDKDQGSNSLLVATSG